MQSNWPERQARYYYKVTPFLPEMVMPGKSITGFVKEMKSFLGLWQRCMLPFKKQKTFSTKWHVMLVRDLEENGKVKPN